MTGKIPYTHVRTRVTLDAAAVGWPCEFGDGASAVWEPITGGSAGLSRLGLAVGVVAIAATLMFSTDALALTPTQPRFVALPSTLTVPRYGAAAAPTFGKVLFVGGSSSTGVDLFDPALGSAGVFGPLSGTGGTLDAPRTDPFAAPLPGGKVLIGGGYVQPGPPLASAEIYDPATGAITSLPTGPQVPGPETQLHTGRYGAFAAPLADGRVLIGGGIDSSGQKLRTAEIFDPATDDFTTDPQLMESARSQAAAAPISGGRVLIAGGINNQASTVLSSVEIYDPSTGGFAEPQGGMTRPRVAEIAVELADGKVLIAGGDSGGAPIRGAEIYDPSNSTSTQLPESGTTELTTPRGTAAAAALPDGRILIAGGTTNQMDSLSSAEVFESASEAAAPDTDFGSQTIGQTDEREVTVTNLGAQPLDIEGFALGGTNSGDFSIGSSTCPSVPIAFDGTCTVAVDFKPRATGHRVATVRLSDNEPVPLTMIVSGAGASAAMTGSGGGSTGPAGGGGPATTSSPPAGPHFDVLRCKAVKVTRTKAHHRRTTVQNHCGLAYAGGRVAIGSRSVLATLSRGHVVYATGLATTRKASVLELTARRTLVKASYTLYVSFFGTHNVRRTIHKTIKLTST
jgi:Kelch motif